MNEEDKQLVQTMNKIDEWKASVRSTWDNIKSKANSKAAWNKVKATTIDIWNADEESIEKLPVVKTLKIIVVAILIIWASFLALTLIFGSDTSGFVLGTFGDSFGVVNTLFSGLAFVGVVAAILLQSQELKAQRQELADMRQAQVDQNSIMVRQQIENTLFQMFSFSNSLVQSIQVQLDTENPVGHDAIDHLTQELCFLFSNEVRIRYGGNHSSPENLDLISFDSYFEKFWQQHHTKLEAYLKQQASILKQPDLLPEENREPLLKLSINRLTNTELVLIFICACHSDILSSSSQNYLMLIRSGIIDRASLRERFIFLAQWKADIEFRRKSTSVLIQEKQNLETCSRKVIEHLLQLALT